MDNKDFIAKRAAEELCDGQVVNLGFGLPVLVARYIGDKKVTLFGENGILGYRYGSCKDANMIDGGTNFASPKKGMCFIDSSTAFGLVRGGHLDVSILGGLQVSRDGDLANWHRGNGIGGIGGGIDMACCAKKVIVVMEHTTKDGEPKIVNRCTLKLTSPRCVSTIITERAVIDVNGGLVVRELLNGFSFREVQDVTDAELKTL
jgi:3-oxoacid CoA-transferase B subunit